MRQVNKAVHQYDLAIEERYVAAGSPLAGVLCCSVKRCLYTCCRHTLSTLLVDGGSCR